MLKNIFIYFSIIIKKRKIKYKYKVFFLVLFLFIVFDKILYIEIGNNKIENNDIIEIMNYLNITEYNKIKKKN